MSRRPIRCCIITHRLRLIAALLFCSMATMTWSEGIAQAEQVKATLGEVHAQPAPGTPNDEGGAAIGWLELMIAALGVLALWIFFASGWHRLVRVPRRPQLFPPAVGFALVILLLVASVGGMATARTLFAIEGEPADQAHPVRAAAILVGGSHVAQLLVLILLVVMWSQSRRPLHETRPTPTAAALMGLGGLILFWPIVMLVSFIANFVYVLITGRPVEPIAHGTLALFTEHAIDGWMILLIVAIVVAAPLVEEVMYRGIVQETLGQFGISRWTAIVLTSVFFALMHLPIVEPHALVTLFVLSLGFGWIYERTGRLAAPIAMHAAFNAGNLALVMMGFGS